jgi:hypothetical protein
MQISKQIHGTTMFIDLNDQKILNEINGYLKTEEYKRDYPELIGAYEEKIDPEAVDKDVAELEAKMKSYMENTAAQDVLFDKLPLKKNNRISRQTKPYLHSCVNGFYSDESYGWYGYKLRLAGIDETHAELEFRTMVEHY